MEIEFYGATRRVTGFCHVLRANGFTVLLDCGLVQGSCDDEAQKREPFPFNSFQGKRDQGSILLAGDAGSFIDLVSRDSIYYSISKTNMLLYTINQKEGVYGTTSKWQGCPGNSPTSPEDGTHY
jgi:hypothetical protein